MRNPCNLGPQEVSFFPREGRVTINDGIQVACKDVFNKSCDLNVVRLHVWQLNPVLERVVSHPVHPSVHSLASLLRVVVLLLFLLGVELTLNYPVVFLGSVELSPETQLGGTTQYCQTLFESK